MTHLADTIQDSMLNEEFDNFNEDILWLGEDYKRVDALRLNLQKLVSGSQSEWSENLNKLPLKELTNLIPVQNTLPSKQLDYSSLLQCSENIGFLDTHGQLEEGVTKIVSRLLKLLKQLRITNLEFPSVIVQLNEFHTYFRRHISVLQCQNILRSEMALLQSPATQLGRNRESYSTDNSLNSS